MIDPLHSLAFSIQANPGVYAILLGSGASRAANIPTGWEVTVDLIRKLASMHGEQCHPSPELWYQNKFSAQPDYSDILNQLAKSPSERQQLLRAYWEPNTEERQQGHKVPTATHHSIASLVAGGFIRLVLTTNFDRLVETAIAEAGITPSVLSSSDHIQGALPLIHTKCCIVKLHGDYLDTRIKNTTTELKTYTPVLDEFLDRTFDEFGLIVCGWSADWDAALRSALVRAPSRRFTTYWAARNEPTEAAQQLIHQRQAEIIRIDNSDSFFRNIQESVESIEAFSRPHPLSVEATVARLKQYMASPTSRIQLFDLIDETVKYVLEATSHEAFNLRDGTRPDNASITDRVRRYETACSTLLAMAPIAGFWAEQEQYQVWQRALQRLDSQVEAARREVWTELQRYPATLLLYALGLGAVEAKKYEFLKALLDTVLFREYQKDETVSQVLPPFCLFTHAGNAMQLLEGMKDRFAPLNDWIHDTLRESAKSILPVDSQYTLAFDKLEILIALAGADTRPLSGHYWAPPGAYGYRHQTRERVIREIEESIKAMRSQSPFVSCGLFGEDEDACLQSLQSLRDFIPALRWH